MSQEEDQERVKKNPERVVDEDGKANDKIKNDILEIRQLVDVRDDDLFTAPLIDPELEINRQQATLAWGDTVRRFIRKIRVLLTKDELDESEKYFEEVHLGTETLVPPDTQEYQFSLFVTSDLEDEQIKHKLNLPRSMDPPEPEPFEFNGLKSILEYRTLTHSWTVCVNDDGPPPEHEYVNLQQHKPVPKYILEEALMQADEFLDKVGIGIETDRDGLVKDHI